MRICKGICKRFENKTKSRIIYDVNRRCTRCGVFYGREVIVCPCCKDITRGRKRSNSRPRIKDECALPSISQKNMNPVLTSSSSHKNVQAGEFADLSKAI